jgi:hypothetical protein
MRRYHTHGVSRDGAIQLISFENREPLVERVLKHRMVVLLMIGATNGSPFGSVSLLVKECPVIMAIYMSLTQKTTFARMAKSIVAEMTPLLKLSEKS